MTGETLPLAIAKNFGFMGDKFFEFVQCAFGAVFLEETEEGAGEDDDKNDKRVNGFTK